MHTVRRKERIWIIVLLEINELSTQSKQNRRWRDYIGLDWIRLDWNWCTTEQTKNKTSKITRPLTPLRGWAQWSDKSIDLLFCPFLSCSVQYFHHIRLAEGRTMVGFDVLWLDWIVETPRNKREKLQNKSPPAAVFLFLVILRSSIPPFPHDDVIIWRTIHPIRRWRRKFQYLSVPVAWRNIIMFTTFQYFFPHRTAPWYFGSVCFGFSHHFVSPSIFILFP